MITKTVAMIYSGFQNIYGLLTKLVRSRWLDIRQVHFCVFMDRDEVDVHKHAKKNEGTPVTPVHQPSKQRKLILGVDDAT